MRESFLKVCWFHKQTPVLLVPCRTVWRFVSKVWINAEGHVRKTIPHKNKGCQSERMIFFGRISPKKKKNGLSHHGNHQDSFPVCCCRRMSPGCSVLIHGVISELDQDAWRDLQSLKPHPFCMSACHVCDFSIAPGFGSQTKYHC